MNDKLFMLKNASLQIKNFADSIAMKYGMTTYEFEAYISDKKNFSAIDWHRLCFFREKIKSGSSSSDFKSMINYILSSKVHKKSCKKFAKKNWDRV